MSNGQNTIITEEQAEEQLNKWLTLIGQRERKIKRSAQLQALKENLIDAILDGDVRFSDDNEIIYTLRFPVDTTKEIKIKNRVKMRKLIKFSDDDDGFTKATKALSARTGIATLIIDEFEDIDYNFAIGLLGFFA